MATPQEIALSVKALKENTPALLELAEMQASMLWHTYRSLIRQGFSVDQAMSIVLVKAAQ